MKKILSYFIASSLAICLMNCKGEQGEIGPKGTQGVAGQNGTDGVAGTKGATGDKGASGDKGATGDQGKAVEIKIIASDWIPYEKYVLESDLSEGDEYEISSEASFDFTKLLPAGLEATGETELNSLSVIDSKTKAPVGEIYIFNKSGSGESARYFDNFMFNISEIAIETESEVELKNINTYAYVYLTPIAGIDDGAAALKIMKETRNLSVRYVYLPLNVTGGKRASVNTKDYRAFCKTYGIKE